MRRQIIATTLHKKQIDIARKPNHQIFKRIQIQRNIFANSCMRAPARLNPNNAIGLKRLVTQKKLGILPRKNIIRNHTETKAIAQGFAQHANKRRLPRTHRTTNPHGKRPLRKIAIAENRLAQSKIARRIKRLVRMIVVVMMIMHSKSLVLAQPVPSPRFSNSETTANTDTRAYPEQYPIGVRSASHAYNLPARQKS